MIGSIAFWRWWATRRREPDELDEDGARRAARRRRPGADRHRRRPRRDHAARRSASAGPSATRSSTTSASPTSCRSGLALYSRAAPQRLEGLVIGVYYLHLFIGNTFVGWLAGLLETMPGPRVLGPARGAGRRCRGCCCSAAGSCSASCSRRRTRRNHEQIRRELCSSPARVLVGILMLGALIPPPVGGSSRTGTPGRAAKPSARRCVRSSKARIRTRRSWPESSGTTTSRPGRTRRDGAGSIGE